MLRYAVSARGILGMWTSVLPSVVELLSMMRVLSLGMLVKCVAPCGRSSPLRRMPCLLLMLPCFPRWGLRGMVRGGSSLPVGGRIQLMRSVLLSLARGGGLVKLPSTLLCMGGLLPAWCLAAISAMALLACCVTCVLTMPLLPWLCLPMSWRLWGLLLALGVICPTLGTLSGLTSGPVIRIS